jgi:hypothetical protein
VSIIPIAKRPGEPHWARKQLLDRAYHEDDRLSTEPPSTGNRRKARRRWCRGKVGIEHRAEWVKGCTARWINSGGVRHEGAYWRLTCRECGRKMQLEYREA